MIRGPSDQYLLFRTGACIGALALHDVCEVMRPLPVAAIAGAPEAVLGIAVIRGAPSPIVDAGRLLGEPTESRHAAMPGERFISLQLGTRSACLAVDAVLGIRRVSQAQLQHTPPLLREAGVAPLARLGALDRELLIVLNTARLIPDGVWTAMQTVEIHD